MIVFNLTDRAPPYKPLSPLDLRIFGKVLEPGEHGEFPDDSPLGKISGWVYSGRVGVDKLPVWYKAATRAESQAVRIVPDSKPKLVEPVGDSVTVDVGIMEVTVDTGPDKKLGTEDDTVEIRLKSKSKKKGKKR